MELKKKVMMATSVFLKKGATTEAAEATAAPNKADWLAVARVFNRLFLIGFLVILTIGATAILSQTS